MDFSQKYLKYKIKYTQAKLAQRNLHNQNGGGSSNKTDIYLFKAEWCGHCTAFKSTWDKIKSEYKQKYNFITVDASEKEKIEQWKINGFPTLIKVKNSNAEEYVGPRTYESVTEFIKN